MPSIKAKNKQTNKQKETTSQNYASTPKTKQFPHYVKEQICVSLYENHLRQSKAELCLNPPR